MRKIIFAIICLSIVTYASAIPPNKMAKSEDHETAVNVLKARLGIIRSEITISEVAEKYYRGCVDRYKKTASIDKGAVSVSDMADNVFKMETAAAEVKRHHARLAEVTALLEYARETGTIDPSLTIR